MDLRFKDRVDNHATPQGSCDAFDGNVVVSWANSSRREDEIKCLVEIADGFFNDI
jgi:hypothetical protein